MKCTINDKFLITSKRFCGLLPVVVDIETSGVNPESSTILEIASLVLFLNEDLKLKFGDFFSCHVQSFSGSKFDPESMNVNLIDNKNPFRLAISEEEAINRLFRFVYINLKFFECKKAVLVGHNAQFDLSFLESARKRYKIDSPFHSFTVIDTATLGAIFYGKTVLSSIAHTSNIRFDSKLAHSAVYDTKITADFFCSVVNNQERYLKNFFKRIFSKY